MIKVGDILVRYKLESETNKILYDDVEIIKLEENDKAVIKDEDGFVDVIDLDLVNERIQDDDCFYMSNETFMKAYMIFEQKIQLEKVCIEDDLRRISEMQQNFYKVNSTERNLINRKVREEREVNGSVEPVIPIFYEK